MEDISLYNYGILLSTDFIAIMKRENGESCQTTQAQVNAGF